jgi:hypothetical protein
MFSRLFKLVGFQILDSEECLVEPNGKDPFSYKGYEGFIYYHKDAVYTGEAHKNVTSEDFIIVKSGPTHTNTECAAELRMLIDKKEKDEPKNF